MVYCANDLTHVMSYTSTHYLASYATLSKRTTIKVIEALRVYPVLTDKATQKFIKFAQQEGITVFPKGEEYVYDKTSSTDPLYKLNLKEINDFSAWITFEGVHQGDISVVKQFKAIKGHWIQDVQSNIHLESGDNASFSGDQPKNVTYGCIRSLSLGFVQTQVIPIKVCKSVENVQFATLDDYDLIFLQQFTRLKTLIVEGYGRKSLSKPSLSYLEKLEMNYTKVVVENENLREMQIIGVFIDDELAEFISKQSRLLFLNVNNIRNSSIIRFPASITILSWLPNTDDDLTIFDKNVALSCMKLKLRKFRTNQKIDTIDWLQTKKIKMWEINGVKREISGGKFVLAITEGFYRNVSLMNREAAECFVETGDISSLNLIDKETGKVTLEKELSGENEELPVLKGVTDLTITYEVTESQAKLLTRVFPQFTEREIIEKGEVN